MRRLTPFLLVAALALAVLLAPGRQSPPDAFAWGTSWAWVAPEKCSCTGPQDCTCAEGKCQCQKCVIAKPKDCGCQGALGCTCKPGPCDCENCRTNPIAQKPKELEEPEEGDGNRPEGEGWRWDADRELWWRPLPMPPARVQPMPMYYQPQPLFWNPPRQAMGGGRGGC